MFIILGVLDSKLSICCSSTGEQFSTSRDDCSMWKSKIYIEWLNILCQLVKFLANELLSDLLEDGRRWYESALTVFLH